MSRHSERFRELREQRKAALRRLDEARGDEWEERSKVARLTNPQVEIGPPVKWLTPQKAQAITVASLAVGGAIVGFLKAIGAFK
jgi:cytochrome c-type biogenesis protein CcmH/NrfG